MLLMITAILITSFFLTWLAIPYNSNEQEGEEGEDATKADTDQGETNCQDQPTNLEIIWVIVEDDEIEER